MVDGTDFFEPEVIPIQIRVKSKEGELVTASSQPKVVTKKVQPDLSRDDDYRETVFNEADRHS